MEYGRKIVARFEPGMLGVAIHLFEQLPTGRFVYQQAGELKKVQLKSGVKAYAPTLFLEDDLAEQLYLELDKIFGKERAVGNNATLEATKYHLEDMRRLAFGEERIEMAQMMPPQPIINPED